VSRLEAEIGEQPETLARLLDEGRRDAERIAADLGRAAPAFLVVAARGSSDNAARYAQYLFGAHNRLVVALASPSLHTLYRAAPSLRGGAVLALSQSGQSPDIVAVVDEARRQGVPALALTNDPSSPLARAASHVLPLRAGEERAVAASKSYTAELAALAMLSAALAGDEARWAELLELPSAVAGALAANPSPDAAFAAGAERLAVLGRGFSVSTAHEIALKVKETGYLLAEASSWADFEHGPMALVEPGFPALLVAPSGATAADAAVLLTRLRGQGAQVIVLSDREELAPALRMPRVPEWLSPAVAVVPGQLWAVALARARGVDPDAPRGLSKVTRTL
jgi:glucosamine--fructose-6-phosphate aminotransferase (isomerizing)